MFEHSYPGVFWRKPTGEEPIAATHLPAVAEGLERIAVVLTPPQGDDEAIATVYLGDPLEQRELPAVRVAGLSSEACHRLHRILDQPVRSIDPFCSLPLDPEVFSAVMHLARAVGATVSDGSGLDPQELARNFFLRATQGLDSTALRWPIQVRGDLVIGKGILAVELPNAAFLDAVCWAFDTSVEHAYIPIAQVFAVADDPAKERLREVIRSLVSQEDIEGTKVVLLRCDPEALDAQAGYDYQDLFLQTFVVARTMVEGVR